MTALIGTICVGALWVTWVTWKIISFKKEMTGRVSKTKDRNAKLAIILNNENNGKETKGQAEETKRDSFDTDGGQS